MVIPSVSFEQIMMGSSTLCYIQGSTILVKSAERPPMFLSIFSEAISTVTITFASPNRATYQ